MTKEEFNIFWTKIYPEAIPISYLFKQIYSDRWFRIHSLPESKRYAESSEDWNILLARQNQIIDDLFADDEKILLVTGEYNWGEPTVFVTDEENIFLPYSFIRLDNISLAELNSDEYDEQAVYRPAFAEITWKKNRHNNLLKAIANGEVLSFFVSFEKNIIVAPYDGGVDFIFKDSHTKDDYKEKYKQWLSGREDGL
jgi:hypothetical protein